MFTPIDDYLAVLPDHQETETEFGLVIAGAENKIPTTGTVTAVGPGRLSQNGEYIELECKVGDRVFFREIPRPTVFPVDGTPCILLRYSELIAVI